MEIDTNWTPEGFPPAPVIDGVRYYYPKAGPRSESDRAIGRSGTFYRHLTKTATVEGYNDDYSAIIRTIPAPASEAAPGDRLGAEETIQPGVTLHIDRDDKWVISVPIGFDDDRIGITVEQWRQHANIDSKTMYATRPSPLPSPANDGMACMLPKPDADGYFPSATDAMGPPFEPAPGAWSQTSPVAVEVGVVEAPEPSERTSKVIEALKRHKDASIYVSDHQLAWDAIGEIQSLLACCHRQKAEIERLSAICRNRLGPIPAENLIGDLIVVGARVVIGGGI